MAGRLRRAAEAVFSGGYSLLNPRRSDDVLPERAPMKVGERLYANPCDVVVTSRPWPSDYPGGVWARAYCYTCDDEHILDAGLFDRGRGPWRRVVTLTEDDDDESGFLAAFVECTECKTAVLTMVHTAEDGTPYVNAVTCSDH